MGIRRHGAESLGPYYWLAVRTIEPFMSVWTKRSRKGLENLSREYPPSDGIIVAPNHMSWMDPLNLCHVMWNAGRPPRFMAKDALFNIPVIGNVMGGAGQIPVYRESSDPASALKDAIAALENGEAVVIYPEGTMTRDPDFWPMTGRTGAAHMSLITGCPVIPIAQWGPQEVLKPYTNDIPKLFPRKTMYTNVGEPVDLDDLRGQEMTSEVLKEATRRIIDAITALLEEIRGEEAPEERLDFRDWKKDQEAKQAAAEKAAKKK